MTTLQITAALFNLAPQAIYINATERVGCFRGLEPEVNYNAFVDFGPAFPGIHVMNKRTADELLEGAKIQMEEMQAALDTQNGIQAAIMASADMVRPMAGGDVVLGADGLPVTEEQHAAAELLEQHLADTLAETQRHSEQAQGRAALGEDPRALQAALEEQMGAEEQQRQEQEHNQRQDDAERFERGE